MSVLIDPENVSGVFGFESPKSANVFRSGLWAPPCVTRQYRGTVSGTYYSSDHISYNQPYLFQVNEARARGMLPSCKLPDVLPS
jgi:hypothetical protein